MIKELLHHWFGIEFKCLTCEVLKKQLEIEQQFNKVMFDKLIVPVIPEPVTQQVPAMPIARAMSFRQAVKEREEQDRIAARKLKSIDELEKELQVRHDNDAEESHSS